MNRQLNCKPLEDLFAYGLIRERTAALFTDAIRAQIMETQGYDVQILEFIDMEHTPKNILIRAVKGGERAKKQTEEYRNCCQLLGVKPTLEKLLWEGEDIRG